MHVLYDTTIYSPPSARNLAKKEAHIKRNKVGLCENSPNSSRFGVMHSFTPNHAFVIQTRMYPLSKRGISELILSKVVADDHLIKQKNGPKPSTITVFGPFSCSIGAYLMQT
jgi:hypothetical protein